MLDLWLLTDFAAGCSEGPLHAINFMHKIYRKLTLSSSSRCSS